MRPSGSPESLEVRRKIAARLFARGMTLTEVAAAVGSSLSSAHRWREAWRRGGKLCAKRHRGRKPKLSAQQQRKLISALSQGTRHWGYASSGWTGPLVRDVIDRLFGVEYHPCYVPRLLRNLGWSPQKPIQRARERDEAAIARWSREDWPRIKKRASNAMLALFFSTKAAICCNRCAAGYGRRGARHRASVSGIAMIGSPHWQP